MTETQLTALCALWQKRLRLQDWEIGTEFGEIGPKRSGRDHGQQESQWGPKTAIITIFNNGDGQEELTLVHELLHIHLLHIHFDRVYERREHDSLETALDQIAIALIRAYIGRKKK